MIFSRSLSVVSLLLLTFIFPTCSEAADPAAPGDSRAAKDTGTSTGTAAAPTATTNPSLVDLIKQTKSKAAGESAISAAMLESLVVRLETHDPAAKVDQEILAATKKFAAGDMQPGVFAGYLKTVLREPWHQYLAWLTAEAKAGKGWACFYLMNAHIKKLRETTHLLPLKSIAAPTSAERYRNACLAIIASDGFYSTHQKLLDAVVLGERAKHAPTVVQGVFSFAHGNVMVIPKKKDVAKRIQDQLPSGHPMAVAAKGYLLLFGYGVEADPPAGIKLIREAADDGLSWAHLLLGYAYRNGIGVEKNVKRAVEYFQTAADDGEPTAFSNLAQMHDAGEHFPKDRAKALALFRQAAEMGNGIGRQQLGWAFFKGNGVKQDKTAGVNWWTLGAKSADAESLRLAGWANAHGVGTEKNLAKARNFYYPLHYRAKTSLPEISAWSDRYRNAKWVTSQQLLSAVNKARLEVNIDKDMTKFHTRAKLEAAVIEGLKRRGIQVDPKASAKVVVDFTGNIEQDNALNRALIVCKLVLPATIKKKNKFLAFDCIARCNQQVHQMPKRLIRGVNDTVFYNQVRSFISTTLTGDSKSVEIKNLPLKLDKTHKDQTDAFLDYHAAHAVRDVTADYSWIGLKTMTQPRISYGGDRNAIDTDSFQQYWVKQLQSKGMQFDPQSTAKVDHLIVVVTNSYAKHIRHFVSVVTIREGNVLYEINGQFLRYHGWLTHNPVASVTANNNLGKALANTIDQWYPVIARGVLTGK